MNQKAQFFIAIAVILAVVITNLFLFKSLSRNEIEKNNFYAIAENYEREMQKIVDFCADTNDSDCRNIDDFTIKFTQYLADKMPDAEFFYVYGSKDKTAIFAYTNTDLQISFDDKTETLTGCRKVISNTLQSRIGSVNFNKKVKQGVIKQSFDSCKIEVSSQNIVIKFDNLSKRFLFLNNVFVFFKTKKFLKEF